MQDIMSYVVENAVILIPVLYIIGTMLKGTEKIDDKYIPLILLPVGVILAMLLLGFNVSAVIQGVLVTGASVYVNQLFKQSNK